MITPVQIEALRKAHKIVTVDKARRMLFKRAMVASKGKQELAAKLLGVDQKTIWRWMRES